MVWISWWLISFTGINLAKGFGILHILCGYQRQELLNSILKITGAYLQNASWLKKYEINKIQLIAHSGILKSRAVESQFIP